MFLNHPIDAVVLPRCSESSTYTNSNVSPRICQQGKAVRVSTVTGRILKRGISSIAARGLSPTILSIMPAIQIFLQYSNITTPASNPPTKSWLIEASRITTGMWDIMNELVSDAAVVAGALGTRECKQHFRGTIAITVWLRLIYIITARLVENPGV